MSYNPDQERDERGRFAGGRSGGELRRGGTTRLRRVVGGERFVHGATITSKGESRNKIERIRVGFARNGGVLAITKTRNAAGEVRRGATVYRGFRKAYGPTAGSPARGDVVRGRLHTIGAGQLGGRRGQ